VDECPVIGVFSQKRTHCGSVDKPGTM